MNKETFETLISDKPLEVKQKAELLWNGMTQGANAYKNEPTAARLKDWRSAEAALEEFIASIGGGSSQTETTFPSIPAVVEYLHAQGWKISTRTGYNHNKKGLIRPRKDGKYYLSDVNNYAQSGALQRLDGARAESFDLDTERKKRADADNAEAIARINKKKAEAIEGRYIERYEFERALAQRAALFKSDIEAFIRGTSEERVGLVGGDAGKVPDLIEYDLDQFERCLGRYSETIWDEDSESYQGREFSVPASLAPVNIETHEESEEEMEVAKDDDER